MIIVLSPAKSLDYETPPHVKKHTLPEFVDEAAELIDGLKKLSPQQIGSLMRISDPLAQLNFQRYADWSPRFGTHNAKQAMLAFNGDVYEGFDAKSLSASRSRLRAESCAGAVGAVRLAATARPVAAVSAGNGHPVRECARQAICTRSGASESRPRSNAQLKKQRGARVLVNCASEEYFKSVKPKLLNAPVISPVFEDWKGGRYKIISFHAKRARGLMARYAVEHRIDEPRSAAGLRQRRLRVRQKGIERYNLCISPAHRRVKSYRARK